MLAGADGPQRHLLRANGSTLIKPGYIAVYQEGRDDAVDDDSDHVLPAMQVGDAGAAGASCIREQHFTEPPPRYTEASLVKALEEYGIGRPSTYASIISTLRDREYVEIENRRFTATDIGKIVCRFLTDHFHRYVDYGFTAGDGGRARCGGTRRGALDHAAVEILEAVHPPGRADREDRDPRAGRAGARARPRSGERQAGHACAWGASARSCRSAPRTTRKSRALPDCARARRWTRIAARRRLRAVQAAAHARHDGRRARPVLTAIGRFGPYVKYGAKYVSLKEDDPYTITLERALEVIQAKAIADANRIIQDFAADEDPGAQRPLRTLHHRQHQERARPQGSRSQDPDARGMPGAAGRGARQGQRAAGSARRAAGQGERGDGGRSGNGSGGGQRAGGRPGKSGASGGIGSAGEGASGDRQAQEQSANGCASGQARARRPKPAVAAKARAAEQDSGQRAGLAEGRAGALRARREISPQLSRRKFCRRAQARRAAGADRGPAAQGQGLPVSGDPCRRAACTTWTAPTRTRAPRRGSGIGVLRGPCQPAVRRSPLTSPPSSACARDCGSATLYPGSPVLAAQALRAQDRGRCCEIQAAECRALERALQSYPRMRCECIDGYAGLARAPAAAGAARLVLIDPPYEEQDGDLARAIAAIDAVAVAARQRRGRAVVPDQGRAASLNALAGARQPRAAGAGADRRTVAPSARRARRPQRLRAPDRQSALPA